MNILLRSVVVTFFVLIGLTSCRCFDAKDKPTLSEQLHRTKVMPRSLENKSLSNALDYVNVLIAENWKSSPIPRLMIANGAVEIVADETTKAYNNDVKKLIREFKARCPSITPRPVKLTSGIEISLWEMICEIALSQGPRSIICRDNRVLIREDDKAFVCKAYHLDENQRNGLHIKGIRTLELAQADTPILTYCLIADDSVLLLMLPRESLADEESIVEFILDSYREETREPNEL